MAQRNETSRPRIAVVGSINMDLLVSCGRLPRPGETIQAESIQELPGGKGANQAVAAARLGAEVSFVGRIGDDTFAPRLLANLQEEKVDTQHIKQTADCASGVAIVAVESSGENAITIVSGANGLVSPADVQEAAEVIANADILLLQLEVPVETVIVAIGLARTCGTPVMLDPAPAPQVIPSGLLEVDFLCPNESEAAQLTGSAVDNDSAALDAAKRLCKMGVGCAIITRGSRGALACRADGTHEFVESMPVTAVDTTAAGDAFAGAFAVRLSEGGSPFEAAQFACQAGAVAASRLGAQQAMPSRDDIGKMQST